MQHDLSSLEAEFTRLSRPSLSSLSSLHAPLKVLFDFVGGDESKGVCECIIGVTWQARKEKWMKHGVVLSLQMHLDG